MASSAKEQKVQDGMCNREFQIWWIEKHGNISKSDKAVCVLCSGVVCAAGRSSLVVKVSDRGWHVTSSSPVPLKTRRVGEGCTLNLSRRPPVSVVVRRGGRLLRCRPHHLTIIQNDEVRRQKPSCS
ncbi:uncharacterized protein TNCV_2860661 [Trichonephila clavipes]|nr:uncharacterized protein TNCV_2860661 [Trichonephila clavipes]